jgi:hypothetical protein
LVSLLYNWSAKLLGTLAEHIAGKKEIQYPRMHTQVVRYFYLIIESIQIKTQSVGQQKLLGYSS